MTLKREPRYSKEFFITARAVASSPGPRRRRIGMPPPALSRVFVAMADLGGSIAPASLLWESALQPTRVGEALRRNAGCGTPPLGEA